jgi:ArsR family transcriptional regulator
LAYLRRAGIVAARREGKWMHYRVTTPRNAAAASILASVLDELRQDPQLQGDHERLSRACCQPTRFVALEGAPVPTPV